jgi:menaquinone-dependent protoporphyrinogen IX oxidase
MTEFEQVVSTACEYLRREWPTELKHLNWQVQDAPELVAGATEVARYSINPETMTVIIYRLPLLRLTHNRRTDYIDERIHIEQEVFSAVAELMGREPWH